MTQERLRMLEKLKKKFRMVGRLEDKMVEDEAGQVGKRVSAGS